MSSRIVFIIALVALTSFSTSHTSAQGRGAQGSLPEGQTFDHFPQPIARDEGVITVTLREFASLPDVAGVAARMMTLVEEPSTKRLFVSDMRGTTYRSRNHSREERRAGRADLRFDANAAGQIFLLNKADGTIRVVER